MFATHQLTRVVLLVEVPLFSVMDLKYNNCAWNIFLKNNNNIKTEHKKENKQKKTTNFWITNFHHTSFKSAQIRNKANDVMLWVITDIHTQTVLHVYSYGLENFTYKSRLTLRKGHK